MLNTAAFIAIDQVQEANKQLINTFVKNDTIATIFHKLVDTQAEFTKTTAKTSIDMMTAFSKRIMTPAYK